MRGTLELVRRPARAVTPLALAAGLAVAAAGCGPDFHPPSEVRTLRVLAVRPSTSYPAAGETVVLDMLHHDGREEGPSPIQITWIAGCYDPPGDLYYGCYEQIEERFTAVASGAVAPTGLALSAVGATSFTTTVPEDIVSRRPPPPFGPRYGISFVFFAACAGRIGPLAADEAPGAPLPLGCFDALGGRVGPDGFVLGYTALYSFCDAATPSCDRTNANPRPLELRLDGDNVDVALGGPSRDVPRCEADDDERLEVCPAHELDIVIDPHVAEPDVGALGKDGAPLREAVWVKYYTTAGALDGGVRLVSDAELGYTGEHGATFVAPSAPGPVELWAVVHDSRGGMDWAHGRIEVR